MTSVSFRCFKGLESEAPSSSDRRLRADLKESTDLKIQRRLKVCCALWWSVENHKIDICGTSNCQIACVWRHVCFTASFHPFVPLWRCAREILMTKPTFAGVDCRHSLGYRRDTGCASAWRVQFRLEKSLGCLHWGRILSMRDITFVVRKLVQRFRDWKPDWNLTLTWISERGVQWCACKAFVAKKVHDITLNSLWGWKSTCSWVNIIFEMMDRWIKYDEITMLNGQVPRKQHSFQLFLAGKVVIWIKPGPSSRKTSTCQRSTYRSRSGRPWRRDLEGASVYPLVNVYQKTMENSPFLMGKLTINGHFQ